MQDELILHHGLFIYLACMGSLGLPVQTKVLAGTEESSRPLRREGEAQDALEMAPEVDLEDTFSRKWVIYAKIAF